VRTVWRRPKAPGVSEPAAPTWASWREGLAVVTYRPHLVKTVRIAVLVGTLLFAINQLDVFVRHEATGSTYLKVALTYLVPFCVSNYGLLVAARRPVREAARCRRCAQE
jgi:hypothetical protein